MYKQPTVCSCSANKIIKTKKTSCKSCKTLHALLGIGGTARQLRKLLLSYKISIYVAHELKQNKSNRNFTKFRIEIKLWKEFKFAFESFQRLINTASEPKTFNKLQDVLLKISKARFVMRQF